MLPWVGPLLLRRLATIVSFRIQSCREDLLHSIDEDDLEFLQDLLGQFT